MGRSILRQDSLCGLPALSGPGAAAEAAAAASELSALVPGPNVRELPCCAGSCWVCNSAHVVACLGVRQVKTMVKICQEQQLWQSHRV